MSKLNRILIGVLVVQIVVAAIILWPRPVVSGEGQSLFRGVEAERIAKLTITAADGSSIHLAKSGSGWMLPDADDYPVLEDKVPPLLEKIAGLKAERLVTQTAGSHKRLQVAEDSFERRIEFVLDDGVLHTLYLGSSPSYGTTHVRADNQNEVYLTSELSAQDAAVDASSWVDRDYLDIPQDQIVAVTLENANGRFEFAKIGEETWMMTGLQAGEAYDEAKVKALVNKARYTTMLRPLGKIEKAEYGLANPQAIVTIVTESADTGTKTYVLQVGAKDPADNSYVVKSSGSAYYVRVSEFTVNEFVEKVQDDLLMQPPTPTPATPPQGQ
jgi:hypothetical protein